MISWLAEHDDEWLNEFFRRLAMNADDNLSGRLDPSERFSVYYFSSPELGNIHERECHLVELAEAKKWFQHHTTNVAAKLGLTRRVLMTDGGDMIVAEWRYGEGIVWPKVTP